MIGKTEKTIREISKLRCFMRLRLNNNGKKEIINKRLTVNKWQIIILGKVCNTNHLGLK